MKNKEKYKGMLGGFIWRSFNPPLYVKAILENKDHFWVTFDKGGCKKPLEGEKMYPCYYPTNRSLKALIKNTKIAWNVLHKEKPDLIISAVQQSRSRFFILVK